MSHLLAEEGQIIENAIQIVSDIHLEFEADTNKMPQIEVTAPILGLLGDIGYPGTDKYQQFVQECSSKFQHVIIIAGNHEYYEDCIQTVDIKINEIAKQYNNVHFLQCQSLELADILPGHIILGCTLWVKFEDKFSSKDLEQIGDYNYISIDSDKQKPLTVNDTNKIYEQHLEFITKQCENAKLMNKKVIVLTHHAPTDYKCINPYYRHEIEKEMNYTNIEYLLQPPVVAWFFGHTHYNMDILIKCDLKQMRYTENEEQKYDDKSNKSPPIQQRKIVTELFDEIDGVIHSLNLKLYDGKKSNQIEVEEEKSSQPKDSNNDMHHIWYVRVATNQQGYIHKGQICDGYLFNKTIAFPIKCEKHNEIEIISYRRLAMLSVIKMDNMINT